MDNNLKQGVHHSLIMCVGAIEEADPSPTCVVPYSSFHPASSVQPISLVSPVSYHPAASPDSQTSLLSATVSSSNTPLAVSSRVFHQILILSRIFPPLFRFCFNPLSVFMPLLLLLLPIKNALSSTFPSKLRARRSSTAPQASHLLLLKEVFSKLL